MATSLDYGKCAQCGRENPKAIQVCRGCEAALPWVKAGKGIPSSPAPMTGAPTFQGKGSKPARPSFSLGDVAWGSMGVQFLGGAVFVGGILLRVAMVLGYVPYIPFAGYFVMVIGAAIFKAGMAMD